MLPIHRRMFFSFRLFCIPNSKICVITCVSQHKKRRIYCLSTWFRPLKNVTIIIILFSCTLSCFHFISWALQPKCLGKYQIQLSFNCSQNFSIVYSLCPGWLNVFSVLLFCHLLQDEHRVTMYEIAIKTFMHLVDFNFGIIHPSVWKRVIFNYTLLYTHSFIWKNKMNLIIKLSVYWNKTLTIFNVPDCNAVLELIQRL